MPRHIDTLEARQRAHADVVKLRKQKCIDEMPAIDAELRVIDRFLRNLEPRRTGPQESTAASPVELRFCLARTSDEIWQIKAEQVVTFDHIRIAFLDETR